MAHDLQRQKALSNVIAVVGVGETDYPSDYKASRSGAPTTDHFGFGIRAFKAALDDAGLRREDIDGLIAVSVPLGRLAELLGMEPRWSSTSFDPATALMMAIDAIRNGLAECVAMVKSLNYRSAATQFGGPRAMGADIPFYVYYRPWGFTSQGGFDSVVVQRYMELYGMTHRQLGQVAVAQRAWARMNPLAIMQRPMTIDDYLRYPFVAEPLRLPDYCLINDGGAALIVTTIERAAKMTRHPVVTVKGLGWGEENAAINQLRPKLNFSRKQMRQAASQVYNMAGIGPKDIDAFYFYDNFSGELFYILENFDYCEEGGGAGFVEAMGIGPGGRFPINTSGGMISESYLQGWNAQIEAVRQLRGEAEARQLAGCRHTHYVSNTVAKATSLILERL
jgi:acetyl-CoA acetyltransferase